MFGLATNLMLALTTALAAIGGSLMGHADVADLEHPPDLGGAADFDMGEASGDAGAHVGDGGANAYADGTTEHADGSGSLDVTGVDVPDVPL